jgi:opacity protein-like surface antigen
MKQQLSILALASLSTAAFGGTQAGSSKGPIAPPPMTEINCPPLTYTYAEVGYFHTEVDGPGDLTNSAGYIDLVYDIGNNIFLEGTLTAGSGDFDMLDASAGLGYYYPVTKNFHLTARAGVGYLDVDDSSEGFSEVGYYLAPGFRAMLTCNLELWGKAFYSEYENDDGGSWSVGGGVTYHLNEKMGLTAGYSHSDDGWVAQAGIRFKF